VTPNREVGFGASSFNRNASGVRGANATHAGDNLHAARCAGQSFQLHFSRHNTLTACNG